MLQRQQSLSADAVWDCSHQEKRHVGFCRTGTITLWIHSELGETLQRESRIAGERFHTKVANIKLTPPSQALSLFFFFVCFCLLFLLLFYQHACLTSSTILFERFSSSTGCEFRRGLPYTFLPCAPFSAAITTAASLIRGGRLCRCREVKGTQAWFSGQGAERWKWGWLMDNSESSGAALGSCWDVSTKFTPSSLFVVFCLY